MEFDFDNLTEKQINELIAEAEEDFEYARAEYNDILHRCATEKSRRWSKAYQALAPEIKEQHKREHEERINSPKPIFPDSNQALDYSVLYGDG